MLPSSPSPCTWLSHAPSTTLDKTPHRYPAGFPFHSTPPPTCSAFRSRRLGSGIALSPGFPFRASITAYRTTAFPQSGAHGASQVLRRISSFMPQPEDSGGPPHPHLHGCFVWASGTLTPSPSATNLFRSCTSFQGTRSPLRPTGFSVYASPALFARLVPPDSAAGATLDTGGWLALSRPGLPPGKMRQAFLARQRSRQHA